MDRLNLKILLQPLIKRLILSEELRLMVEALILKFFDSDNHTTLSQLFGQCCSSLVRNQTPFFDKSFVLLLFSASAHKITS